VVALALTRAFCCVQRLLSAVLLVGCADAQFGGAGDNMFGGPPTNCKAYSCSKGYSPVPKRPMMLNSAGCSGMGGMNMFGGGMGGKQDEKAIVPCCDVRHACYQICGSAKARCDKEFKKCTGTELLQRGAHCPRKLTLFDVRQTGPARRSRTRRRRRSAPPPRACTT
jgi:hypothetical protein